MAPLADSVAVTVPDPLADTSPLKVVIPEAAAVFVVIDVIRPLASTVMAGIKDDVP
jgi:hypothetical protein